MIPSLAEHKIPRANVDLKQDMRVGMNAENVTFGGPEPNAVSQMTPM